MIPNLGDTTVTVYAILLYGWQHNKFVYISIPTNTYTHIHTYILLQITLFIVRKLFPLFSKL